ncbi:lysostaphin resistance A-like protein [Cytobacillus sp. Hz8]|uniref:CPBP family intramembrane glutamic endopeptidase n=1 Tax=Cytobacillus sp. Hz8 TaxID=3347168 RepID=UPI0035DFBEB5
MRSHSISIRGLSYILAFLFIILIYLFQIQAYNILFILLLILLLSVAFFLEENRLFSWTILAYIFSQFIFLYGDRLILNLQWTREWEIIGSRLLLFFPILMIGGLSLKFKRPISIFPFKTNWNQAISLPFQARKIHFLFFYFIIIFIIGMCFLPFLLHLSEPLHLYGFSMVLLLSFINSLLEEGLWRGILLTRLSSIMDQRSAMIFSCLGYGLTHLSLGYSIVACLLFSIEGLILSFLTVKSRSLIPAIIAHSLFNVLMILSGKIPFWIS